MGEDDSVKSVRGRDVAHSMVAILLMLCGGALLGFGTYLQVTRKELVAGKKGPIEDLDYPGGSVIGAVADFGLFGIVAGTFILISGLASCLALKRNTSGKVFRIVYFLMALVILALLAFIAGISFLIVASRKTKAVESFYTDAWENTIEGGGAQRICKIEKRLSCRGLMDGDCKGCILGTESACTGKTRCARCKVRRGPLVGCYNKMLNSAKAAYLPVGIGTAVTAVVLLVDLILVCTL